jgi:hypothetical protein
MTTVDSPPVAAADQELIERFLPTYDIVITERVVVEADAELTFRAARELDFLTVHSPLIAASMFLRGLPAKLRGHTSHAPPELRFADGSECLPGWLFLGEVPGRETAFGAVGKFWKADIEWRDVPVGQFADFHEPGWGKIACHFLVHPAGPGRAILAYECRTATTDPSARRMMLRYWWLIRPFVRHIVRATLRTICSNVETAAAEHRPRVSPPVAHLMVAPADDRPAQ